MNRAITVLLIAAFSVVASDLAMASHTCAYVNDDVSGANTVEGYMVGPGTMVAHVGPYLTNGNGNDNGYYAGGAAALRVSGGDLYVTDTASKNISHFKINKSNCQLVLDPTLYASGDPINAYTDVLAITPQGTALFVGSTGDNHIYSHSIAANGSLGAAFSEVSTPDTPVGIEASSDGQTLIVSYFSTQQICAYPISGGHLGSPNCVYTAGFPNGVSIDPASACVYTAEYNTRLSAEIAAFPLTGGVLQPPTDYNFFGPGVGSNSGIVVNWNNTAIYVNNPYSAQISMGSIASGCKLTYETILSDGSYPSGDVPGQIAQAKIAHQYVVTGDWNFDGTPSMGIFHANPNGSLTPVGTGQFPLATGGVYPSTVVVIDSKSP